MRLILELPNFSPLNSVKYFFHGPSLGLIFELPWVTSMKCLDVLQVEGMHLSDFERGFLWLWTSVIKSRELVTFSIESSPGLFYFEPLFLFWNFYGWFISTSKKIVEFPSLNIIFSFFFQTFDFVFNASLFLFFLWL